MIVFRLRHHRVIRMFRPRQIRKIPLLIDHRDAIHRANNRAEVTPDALFFDDFVLNRITAAKARDFPNGLVGRIFARDVTKTAVNTLILINIRNRLEV